AGAFDAIRAAHAFWDGRPGDAVAAVEDGLTLVDQPDASLLRAQLCAVGLRVQAELAAHARARGAAGELASALEQADALLARAAQAAVESARVSPAGAAWYALCEAEHERAHGRPAPQAFERAAGAWEALERPWL